MNRIIKSLLCFGLVSVTLFSCQKDQEAPIVDEKSKDLQTFSFSGEIDPVYEFDDEESRAAKFTAENAPRIVLTEDDISGGTTNSGKFNLNNARTLEKTTVRVNWLVFDSNRPDRGAQSVEGINTFDGQMLQKTQRQDVVLSKNGNGYRIDMKIRLKDFWYGPGKANYRGANYTWYGNVFLGGFPGTKPDGSLNHVDERAHQYFSRVFSMKIDGGEYIATNPNHRIDELDGTNSSMARRHFPLIGRVTKLRIWNNTNDPSGDYKDDNPNGNTGQIVSNGKFYLEPRGTIFTLTFDNQTGEDIEVTDIEVPFKGTRGQAFSYEGKFVASGFNPEQNNIPVYQRFDGLGKYGAGYVREDILKMYDVETLSFPLYNSLGQPGVSLPTGFQSSGRFMVWAYAHNPEQRMPFTVRVRYRSNGQEYSSKFQTVTPPADGFKEGKAYRFRFVIKK